MRLVNDIYIAKNDFFQVIRFFKFEKKHHFAFGYHSVALIPEDCKVSRYIDTA